MFRHNKKSRFTSTVIHVLLFSWVIAWAIALAGAGSAWAEEWPPYFDDAREIARAEAAAELGVTFEETEVEAETLRSDPEIALFKISAATGVVEIGIDDFLSRVDLEGLRIEHEEAALAIDAKLAQNLGEKVAQEPGETYPILIWLTEPAYVGLDRPDPDAPYDPEALDLIDAELAAHVHGHTEPIVGEAIAALGSLGLEAGGSSNAPLVWTEASGDQILELVHEAWVARIDEDLDVVRELSNAGAAVSRPAAHARTTAWGVPLQGIGRVAIVEPESPWTGHPDLISASNPIQIIRESNSCNFNHEHPTEVMGVIRSTHATHRGMAPTAKGVAGAACSKRFSSVIRTTDKVVDAGNWIINLSWSGGESNRRMGLLDRYYDLVSDRRWRNFTAAAGNGANLIFHPGLRNVKSPAMAYNTLAVGASDDRNTATTSDDWVWGSSSWQNPISSRGDRIKPNVMAPGVDIRTPTMLAQNWVTREGTSLAAPVVASQVGLLLQRNIGLHFAPEISRAIVMASARHNLDGGPWSTKDGAGAVDFVGSDDVARRLQGQGDWGHLTLGCGPFLQQVLTANVTVRAGKKFRAALAWSVDASFPGNTLWELEPGADLDLLLTDSQGNIVARSASWDNAHEILEFVSPFTLALTLQVRRTRCHVDPGKIGWAWWQEA